MTISKIFLFMVVLILTFDGYGQSITWSRVYYPPLHGHGEHIEQTYDGGYIVTGSYVDINNIDKIYLLKLDSLGNILWEKIYSNGTCFSVKQTLDSGYIISGSVNYGFLLKTDKLGNLLWYKVYNQLWIAKSLDITLDRGFVICGSADAIPPIAYKGCILKTDSLGNYQWHSYLNDSVSSRLDHIMSSLDGYYYFSGTMSNINLHNYGIYGKINNDGYNLKFKSVGIYLSGIYKISNPIYISNKNYYLTYHNYLNYVGTFSRCKFDSSLFIYYTKDTLASYDVKSLCKINENKFVNAGFEDFDIRLTFLDSNCNLINSIVNSPTSEGDGVYHITNTIDRGLIYTGLTEYPNNSYENILVVKTDSNGYSNPVGINKINNEIPSEFSITQNYPNPFNPRTNIKIFISKKNQRLSFNIYNTLGQEIFKLNRNFYETGEYVITLDFHEIRKNLSSGLYYLIVSNELTRKSLKIIYCK